MIRHGLPRNAWWKSSYSYDTQGECLELQPTPDAQVAIGDSKSRPRGALVFGPPAWAAFVRAVTRDQLTTTVPFMVG
ncbi:MULTISPECIES: DUF397 domain-containing protein [Streptomyces]|uniref:DUF397 domain-containing protein n=1 Tax=Streptomyces morookaense TaxID=1970 RepID=A0A7Y7B996_STRMO|nr:MULTISPECIES: DUF397 domain-containing protein [Streptomyces]MCC2275705.1 DUF397 domain-containing protein [Streptomyces sp. ET3-23]NVK81383.1 DUF397 domain-containing protein [Streptomyces morookaense]GHF45216.1 hypothetical protein GCM10010359_54780 [Streptomyces morookaense]